MEIDEQGKNVKLWVRRKKTRLKLICSRCGQYVPAVRIHEVCEREVRDLPCFEYMTTVVVEKTITSDYAHAGAPYDTIPVKQVNANTFTDERKKTDGPYKGASRIVVTNGGKPMTTTTLRAPMRIGRGSPAPSYSISSRENGLGISMFWIPEPIRFARL
jgi:hypothetical protein